MSCSKGDLDLLARGKGEEVVAAFEGNDPTVEEFGRFDALSAKVVDEEATAVALHLQRGLADVAVGIVAYFEVVHGEFAANDDGGAADFDPAAVVVAGDEVGLAVVGGLVVGGVVDFDHLSVFDDGMGDPDFLTEAHGDATGEGGLAVPRSAVEEEAGSGIDGGAHTFEEGRVDGDVLEGLSELIAFGRLSPNGLGFDGDDVVGKGNGCGSRVGAGGECCLGALLSLLGEDVDVVVERCGAGVDDELACTEGMEELFEDAEGETNVFGDTTAARGADDGHVFEDKRLDEGDGQSGVFEFRGWRGREGLVGEDLCQETTGGGGPGCRSTWSLSSWAVKNAR